MIWILWVIIAILWTILVVIIGYAAGIASEKDKHNEFTMNFDGILTPNEIRTMRPPDDKTGA